MRAVVLAETGLAEVREVAEPVVREGEVLVEVTRAGICGIDLKMWNGRIEGAVGRVLGHEMVGRTRDGRRVVVDPLMSCGVCAACVRGEANLCARLRMPGMRGVQGCFAQRVAAPEIKVSVVADALPDDRAVMAEPLANVVHAFRLGGMQGAARLGIVGVGQMGAMALQMALRGGSRDVLAVDVCEARVAIARSMGADRAVHWDGAAAEAEARHRAGTGLDVVLDAAGTSEARQLCLSLCRPGGVVVMLGMAEGASAIDFNAAIRRELRVQMSFGYMRRDFAEALDLLAAGAVDFSPWTRTFAMADAQMALEKADAKSDVLKVLLEVGA